MPRLALLTTVFLCLAAAPAAAAELDHGVIDVGRGIAGVRLDMTRAQVIARVGAPLEENANGVLSYSDTQAGGGIFDVYRYGPKGHVRLIVLSFPESHRWVLRDGNPIFAHGAVDRLFRHYGSRLHRRYDQTADERLYFIRSTYKGRPVETQFSVDRFSRAKARILNVFLLFTDRAA